MSAAELRRGEQSVLHCTGTRTLQVRDPPTPLQLPSPTPAPKNLPKSELLILTPRQLCPGPALPRPRPCFHCPLPQVSPPGGGPDVAFRFGAVLDGARTQEDVFRACGVRRLGELALRG